MLHKGVKRDLISRSRVRAGACPECRGIKRRGGLVVRFPSSAHDLATRRTRSPTADDLHRGVSQGDESMVQGIDYTSVSPWNRSDTALGLVRVVYIFRDD